jgi:hypothetical protein
MATITNVTISSGGTVIASAPSGEIAPPPNAPLTVNDATWTMGPKVVLTYLEKTCQVSATPVGAMGVPFNGTYKITGIANSDKTIKLTPIK